MRPAPNPRTPCVITLLAVAAAFCHSAHAKTIHVDNTGQADFDTIQAAIHAAERGDTVSVGPGTYRENVTLKDGVSLAGSGADVTIIDANGYGDVVDVRGSNVTICGFTLRNSGQFDRGHTNCGVHVAGSYAPIIRNNVILNNRIGVGVWDGANPHIANNIIRNNSDGLYIYGSEAKPSNPIIVNNTIVDNETVGITLREMVSPVIANNIIVGHMTGISHNYVTGSPTLKYNDVWDNDVNCLRNSDVDDIVAGSGSISADPCFAETGHWTDANDPNIVVQSDSPNAVWIDGDYHLLPNSPCIDAGDPDFVLDPNSPQTDFYGGPRLAGTRIDIGADEYSKYSGGTGEPNDPYQIATAADLIALGETPEDYDKHFILTADIDLVGHVFDDAVIARTGSFTGVFDGHGYTISHLTIMGKYYLGLFGVLALEAKVRDLCLVGINVTGSSGYVGALAGQSNGVVTGCHSTGAVTGYSDVGGLIGCISKGTLAQSSSTSIVAGCASSVGGLVGSIDEKGAVSECFAVGSVRGGSCAGGLVGTTGDAEVLNCYSNAEVSGTWAVGGFVGNEDDGSDIQKCYSTGTVNGTGNNIGGFLGKHTEGTSEGVTYPQDASVSAAATNVTCFWDKEASGKTRNGSGSAERHSTAEMQTASTFLNAGWDFVGETANGTEDIWWIDEGKDYPRLSWQGSPGMVFVDIPGGTFEMGDHDGVGEDDERPVHTVTLDGFQMSKYETTNAQYAQYLNAAMAEGLIRVVNRMVYASSDGNLTEPYCMPYGADSISQVEYSQGRFTVRSRDGTAMSDHPAGGMSWYGAKAFCDYYGYRLPTEAEWEYAARGRYHDPYYQYPWGSNTIDCTRANYWPDSGPCNPLNLTSKPYTSPVGYYGAQGAYGLCDMSGNMYEWCQDWYDSAYYSASPGSSPIGPATGKYRVLRGGSWSYGRGYCRVAKRDGDISRSRDSDNDYGFRVCR